MKVASTMLIMTDTKNLEKVTPCWRTGVFGNWNSAALAEPYPEKLILKNRYWMSFPPLVSTIASLHNPPPAQGTSCALAASICLCVYFWAFSFIIWASLLYWVIMNSHSLTVCRWGHLHISLQTGNCAPSALHVIMMQLQYFSPFLYFDQQRLITLDWIISGD